MFETNLIKSNKILVPFILLFIIPVLGFIADLNFQYIAHEMKDTWTQDVFYFVYNKSLYIAPLTNIIQFIYFILLMIVSVRAKHTTFILLSAFLIAFNCITGFSILIRFLSAAAGV